MANGAGYARLLRATFESLAADHRTHADAILYARLSGMAAYKTSTITIKGGTLTLAPHELVGTSRELAKALDMDRDTVRRALERLGRAGHIRQETRAINHPATRPAITPQSAPRNAPLVTVVTICNLEAYDKAAETITPDSAPTSAQITPRVPPKNAPEEEVITGNEQRETESKAGSADAPPPPLPFRPPSVSSRREAKPRKAKPPIDQTGDAYRLASLFLDLQRGFDPHAEADLDAWARNLQPAIVKRGAEEVERLITYSQTNVRERSWSTTPAALLKNATKLIGRMIADENPTSGNGRDRSHKGQDHDFSDIAIR